MPLKYRAPQMRFVRYTLSLSRGLSRAKTHTKTHAKKQTKTEKEGGDRDLYNKKTDAKRGKRTKQMYTDRKTKRERRKAHVRKESVMNDMQREDSFFVCGK